MFSRLKTKIWLTVFSIVLIFSFFTLFYFPNQQSKNYLSIYNREAENLAKTVALGVEIAMHEEYYEGEKEALKFATGDKRLKYVSLLMADSNGPDAKFSVMNTVPENAEPDTLKYPKGSIIAKMAPYRVGKMSGAVLLVFSTDEINKSIQLVKLISVTVSAFVFIISMVIGFWLSRNISVPVLALRDAANKVGEGDLSQKVKNKSTDEIGELTNAFNKMVSDLSAAGDKIRKTNIELEDANKKLEHTIEDLKSTQDQLIHAEKMASLGELTAGIAHEIQNPLNFVNNFSELNKELLAELKEEIKNGNFNEVKSIASEVINNEEKINHHGKRAAVIVKGMLQHSRATSGQKELTNINYLCEEYLRLAYLGFRSKEKNFNVELKTDFDTGMGKINIVPQDIGRVVLNLINNAFYAVGEKKKLIDVSFEPTVTVSTKKSGNRICISVGDNGIGIPKTIHEKIFQPFFTTKPTGQGTGLGLSLSYDIIKAHGGEIKLETEQGQGSVFTIVLPIV